MQSFFLILLSGMFFLLHAQENIDPFLLTDSLEIQALLDPDASPEATPETKVRLNSHYGVNQRTFGQLKELNDALDTLGYGKLEKSVLGWAFSNQIDIGEHLSLGFTYLSNYYFGSFNPGLVGSSKLTYFHFLIDLAYRYDLGGLTIAPESGMGVSSNIISFKPNDLEEIRWDDLHQNNALISALNQTDLSFSLGVGLSKDIPWFSQKTRLLKFRTGMIFNPVTINSLGVNNGEWSFVKVEDAPELSSSGLYFSLTFGVPSTK